MAQRRMFSNRIIDSARFAKMPISARALYFYLGMHADDDGVVEGYTVIKAAGCTEDDLKVLQAKGFVAVLNEDLVTYICDWQENNRIRADRKTDSIYKDLLISVLPEVNLKRAKARADTGKKKGETQKQLPEIIDTSVIEAPKASDNQTTSNGRPLDNQRTTNGLHRLGKVRLGEDRLSKDIYVESNDSDAPQPKSKKEAIPYKFIIDYLNRKANRSFNPNTKAYRNLIRARWNDRVDANGDKLTPDEKLEQFKKVIDKKAAEWGSDAKMVNFLRPNTLFAASHFDDYLQPPATVQQYTQSYQSKSTTTGVDWDNYHTEAEKTSPDMSPEEINAIFKKYGSND